MYILLFQMNQKATCGIFSLRQFLNYREKNKIDILKFFLFNMLKLSQ